MSFLDWLLFQDTKLFLFLNGLHTPLLDEFMYIISKVWVWIPLYLGVVAFIIKKWKMESIWIILSIILFVVLSDQLKNITKAFFVSLITKQEPAQKGLVHHVNGYLSGNYSFVSGHSSNVFGFALLSSLILKQKVYTWAIFFWAAAVAYSRIYLGVHYPLDIFGGMVLGVGIALIIYTILRGFQKKLLAEIKSRFF